MKTKTPLVEIKNLSKSFQMGGQELKAVNNISLSIQSGETVGLVGDSGCGKSTLVKTVIRLGRATSGEVLFEGEVFI